MSDWTDEQVMAAERERELWGIRSNRAEKRFDVIRRESADDDAGTVMASAPEYTAASDKFEIMRGRAALAAAQPPVNEQCCRGLPLEKCRDVPPHLCAAAQSSTVETKS